LFFKFFIKQYIKQIKQSSIQLNIIGLEACRFNCITCAKNIKFFSIILQEIDIFLNLVEYYASTFARDIRKNYAIKEICRRLQAMQAIT